MSSAGETTALLPSLKVDDGATESPKRSPKKKPNYTCYIISSILAALVGFMGLMLLAPSMFSSCWGPPYLYITYHSYGNIAKFSRNGCFLHNSVLFGTPETMKPQLRTTKVFLYYRWCCFVCVLLYAICELTCGYVDALLLHVFANNLIIHAHSLNLSQQEGTLLCVMYNIPLHTIFCNSDCST